MQVNKIQAVRYHDISTGHRVVGHENKCRHLHGHNYRVHFYCEADKLDSVGRVIDFGVIKERLCMWLENYWDHKFLAWQEDPVMTSIYNAIPGNVNFKDAFLFQESVEFVSFNPTAENMAQHLLEVVGPRELVGTGVTLTKVVIEETSKCSVSAEVQNV